MLCAWAVPLCKDMTVSRELLLSPFRVYAYHCSDYVDSLENGGILGVQPWARGAMTTSFPAITPNKGHTLSVPATWAEVPRGVWASLGAAACSFLLETNYEREKEKAGR